jgi:cell division septation protein DedD
MAQMDGEKELVLGNKQLISLFFVIVALCGVFFALGYMMGRPSGKQLVAIPDSSPATSSAPSAATTQPHEAEPSAADTPPALPDGQATQVATQTQAAHDVPAPAPSPAPAAIVSTLGPAPATPEAGATYLQVTALGRSDADHLVKTLKEQNFPALLAESSKPELFRVLVGPYHQTADVADAKARLKALGFANAFVQK